MAQQLPFASTLILRFSLATALLAWPGVRVTAIGSDLSEFLHGAFHEQYGRPPTGAEINYYANLSRTNGPLEAYIQMVSADDYYIINCQRNPDVYVTRLYRIFVGRDPRPDEVRYWVNRFYQGAGTDRSLIVRQFCQANNVFEVPGYPPPSQPSFRPGDDSAEVAETLVLKSVLLSCMIDDEFGGSRFGREAKVLAKALTAACTQYRDTVKSPRSTPQQVSIARDNVERAIGDLQSHFRTVPTVSSQCESVLWELSRLVKAGGSYTPGFPPANASGSTVERASERLAVTLRRYADTLATYQSQGPWYTSIYRDVNGLIVQVDSLRELARRTQQVRELQGVVSSIVGQTRRIGNQLVRADPRLQRSWWNVQHQVDQLAQLTNSSGDFYSANDQPVIINHPGWGGFPLQPNPSYRPSDRNEQVIRDCDELITLVDSYINSLRPITGQNRDASRMIDDTLDLRHNVLVLRQQAAMGQFGSRLQYASRDMVRQYSDVASQTFLKMVGQDPRLNSPIWAQIGELAYQIDKGVRY